MINFEDAIAQKGQCGLMNPDTGETIHFKITPDMKLCHIIYSNPATKETYSSGEGETIDLAEANSFLNVELACDVDDDDDVHHFIVFKDIFSSFFHPIEIIPEDDNTRKWWLEQFIDAISFTRVSAASTTHNKNRNWRTISREDG